MHIKLTKSFVEKLPFSVTQDFYRDTELRGFGLRVGTSTKTYFVEGKVNGRTVRTTIGKHTVFSAELARQKARELLQVMARGISPTERKREQKARSVTLASVFEDYIRSRKNLKASTIFDYRRVMRESLADWQNKPMADITKEMVERKHQRLGETSRARANLAMRVLRALFNYAIDKYETGSGEAVITNNPVTRLTKANAWYRVNRRSSVIKAHQLPAWFKAVLALQSNHPNSKSAVIRDYLVTLLLTGLRRGEAAQLRWSDVDFEARTLIVRDTKNRQDHVLPLPNYLLETLTRRRESAEDSKFVFPGNGRYGFLVDPRRQMAYVTAESGVPFTLHDLRRTFATAADSLNMSGYAVKRLLNHKLNDDVTAGYVISDLERLREPMQTIEDYLLRSGGIHETAKVISIQRDIKKVG